MARRFTFTKAPVEEEEKRFTFEPGEAPADLPTGGPLAPLGELVRTGDVALAKILRGEFGGLTEEPTFEDVPVADPALFEAGLTEPPEELPSLRAAGRGLADIARPITQAALEAGPRFREPPTEEPLYDELGLPVGKPEVLGKAIAAPFQALTAPLRFPTTEAVPEAFLEPEDIEMLTREGASLSDLAAQMAGVTLPGFAAGPIPEAPFVQDHGLDRPTAEAFGRTALDLAAIHFGTIGAVRFTKEAFRGVEKLMRRFLMGRGIGVDDAENLAKLFAEDTRAQAMNDFIMDEGLGAAEREAAARAFERKFKFRHPADPRGPAPRARRFFFKRGAPPEPEAPVGRPPREEVGVGIEAPAAEAPAAEAPAAEAVGPTKPIGAKGGVPFKTERGARQNLPKVAKAFKTTPDQLKVVKVADGFGIVGKGVEVSPRVAVKAAKKPPEAVAKKPAPAIPKKPKAPEPAQTTPPGVEGIAEQRITPEAEKPEAEKPIKTVEDVPERIFVSTAKNKRVAGTEAIRWIDATVINMRKGLIKEGGSVEMTVGGVDFMVPNTKEALLSLRKEMEKLTGVRGPIERKVQKAPEVRELAVAAPEKVDYVPVARPPKGKEPLWTNGEIIDKGDRPPVGQKLPDAAEIPYLRVKKDFEKAREHVGKADRKAVAIRFARNPDTGKPGITASLVNKAGDEIQVRSDNLGHFIRQYPDAEFFFKPTYIKRTDRVPVMKEGEVVGHETKLRREAIGDIAVVSEGKYVGTFKSVGASRNLGAKFSDDGKLQSYEYGQADFLETKAPYVRQYGYASAGTDTTGAEGFAAPLANVIDLPEMLEMAKALMGGEIPKIVKHIDRQGRVLGRVVLGGTGQMFLRADIFRDPDLARMVMAHELGHVIDWLPHHTLSRGNILGRIAKFNDIFKKHTLPRFPGAKEELTSADRARLRRQAEKIIREEYKDKWIDEVIIKEMPIEPEDVLNVWNAVDQAGLLNPDLQRYIAELSSVEKKAIVKQALKGVVPEQLQRFAKKVKEKTGKQIKAEIPEDAVAKKYAELIDEEIEKLKLFKMEEVMDELKTLTRMWRPFDPAADPKYTAIRYESSELYADAVSVLFGAPGLLKKVAPNFYEGFFNYLDMNPQVRDLWNEIQDRINSGTTNVELLRGSYEDMRTGDELYGLQLKKEVPWFDRMMREIVDQHWAIVKYEKRFIKAGFDLPPEENPRFAAERMLMSGSSGEWITTRVHYNMMKPLAEVGLRWEDFGMYRKLKRIIASKEARQAEPRAWTPERAEVQMKEWETKTWAGPKWETILKVDEEFNKLGLEVIEKIEKSGRFTEEFIKRMKNEVGDYATWDVLEWIEKRMGTGPTAQIWPKVGTFKGIANPASATVMKWMATLKAANRTQFADVTHQFLKKYQEAFPEEGIKVRPAEKRWNGRFWQIKEPPAGSGLGLITYLKEGKAVGIWVEKFMAEAFERNPIEGWWLARTLSMLANPFRQIFTEINPGFMVVNTFFRDPMRAATNLPEANLRKFLAIWPKALKPAWRSVFGIPDDVAEFALKNEMLISIESARGMAITDKEMERQLARIKLTPGAWDNKIIKPFAIAINFLGNISRVGERAGKIASILYLQKHFPDMPIDQMRHIVMRHGGSPAFMVVGRAHPLLNTWQLFFNAWMQGNRGDYAAMRANAPEWWWKKTKYVLLPKMLMIAAGVGLMGEGIRRVMQGVSSFDMANYIIVPVGLTPSGKSVYIRIPTDEGSRVIGGVFTKMFEIEKPRMRQDLLNYMAGQAPTLNPAIGALVATVQYASGQNPYDSFRGRYAIPEMMFLARDERTHEAFVKWLANKYGSNVVYRFKHDDLDRVKTELEEFLDVPFLSNIFGRFLKVSDIGVKQELKFRRELVKRDNARKILDAKEAMTNFFNDGVLTPADIAALAEKPDIWDRNFMKFMARKYGNAVSEELFSVYHTGSNEEKMAVWQAIEEMNALDNPGEQYRWIWQNDKFVGKFPGKRFEFKRRAKVMPRFKFERVEKGKVTRR